MADDDDDPDYRPRRRTRGGLIDLPVLRFNSAVPARFEDGPHLRLPGGLCS